jgi:cytoskeletal protein CcmA (bactofilin family)
MTDAPRRRIIDRNAATPTLLGYGTSLTGTLECAGDLVVAGHANGKVKVAGSLTIADTGQWEGEIETQVAIIAGEVQGTLTVNEKLEIRRTARIRGTVRAKSIAIATGAVVDGEMAVTGNTPVIKFEERRHEK